MQTSGNHVSIPRPCPWLGCVRVEAQIALAEEKVFADTQNLSALEGFLPANLGEAASGFAGAAASAAASAVVAQTAAMENRNSLRVCFKRIRTSTVAPSGRLHLVKNLKVQVVRSDSGGL